MPAEPNVEDKNWSDQGNRGQKLERSGQSSPTHQRYAREQNCGMYLTFFEENKGIVFSFHGLILPSPVSMVSPTLALVNPSPSSLLPYHCVWSRDSYRSKILGVGQAMLEAIHEKGWLFPSNSGMCGQLNLGAWGLIRGWVWSWKGSFVNSCLRSVANSTSITAGQVGLEAKFVDHWLLCRQCRL